MASLKLIHPLTQKMMKLNKDGQDQKADNRNNNDKNVSNENGLDSDRQA